MRKEKNKIINGEFLLENDPDDMQPWCIWHLRQLFVAGAEGFRCASKEEALDIIAALNKLETKP